VDITISNFRPLAFGMASAIALIAAAPALAAAPAPGEAPAQQLEEVVVTGSRIPNLTSASPVTSVTGAEIKAQGVTRIEDMVNSLPQTFGAQGSGISNRSNGTATVNLRGLGPARTLVLIDGRRLMGGNPASQITAVAPDLNFVPAPLVKRIDVLTGGASAVYGADAVAGVVNFILDRNFHGLRVDAQHSWYQHEQGDEAMQAVLRNALRTAALPDTYNIPPDFSGGEADQVSLTFGVNDPDGRGNLTAFASYLHINGITGAAYDYTACPLASGASVIAAGCTGSGTAYPARIGNLIVDPSGPGNTFRTRVGTDLYNFAPVNDMQRPDERYNLGSFAHYKLTSHAEAYADLMYMEDTSDALIAPAGIFPGGGPGPGGTYAVNCNNPLMTATQQSQLCGANAGTPTLANVLVARRNVEGGGRVTDFVHHEQRYVVGLRGDLGARWTYDSYLQYGKTSLNTRVDNYFVTSRINQALLATRNSAGQIVCVDPSNGCVPYNLFQIGGVNAAQLNFLEAPSYTSGAIVERVANASVVGELPASMKSPLAQERIGVSLGAEYRSERLQFGADALQAAGQLNGGEGAFLPVNGGYDVYEGFGELRVPLVQDRDWAKDVSLELAYRYSDYSIGSRTNTYKVSGDWTVVDGVRLRVGYNRAARAPNVIELFAPRATVLAGSVDPCAGLHAGDALVAKCMSLFGLSQAQVLALEPDPTNQYRSLTGGNPDLRPEKADTWAAGVVWTPDYIPGLNLTLDYYDIKVTDFISGIGANNIQNGCMSGVTPSFCSLIHRDSTGSLRSNDGYVIDTAQNTGGLRTSGVDVEVSYRTDLERFGWQHLGAVSASLIGTRVDKLETTSLKGGTTIDCAGLYGAICSTLGGSNNPNPKWRHKLRLTWETPLSWRSLDHVNLSAQWRHIDAVALDRTSSQLGLGGSNPGGPATDLKLGARDYFDVAANFRLNGNVEFRFGVNNLLDREPPLTGFNACPTGPCNNNIYTQVYDSLGRNLFVGLQADF
jgi:outer membrane receptor protein involved in Fe transport